MEETHSPLPQRRGEAVALGGFTSDGGDALTPTLSQRGEGVDGGTPSPSPRGETE